MSNVWPPKEQMKQFLDDWDTYAERQEKEVDRLNKKYTERVTELEQQIANAKVQATEAERPLRERIVALDGEVIQLRTERDRLSRVVDETSKALAKVLEINTNVPGVTLETMLKDMTLLVEEAKRTFRRSL